MNWLAGLPIFGLFMSMAFLQGNAALAFGLGVVFGLPLAIFGLKSFGPPASPSDAKDSEMAARVLNIAALIMLAGAGWAGFKLHIGVISTLAPVYGNAVGTMLALALGCFLQARRFTT